MSHDTNIFLEKKRNGKTLVLKSRQVWAKLKESENDAVASVYSGHFFDPFDDESP